MTPAPITAHMSNFDPIPRLQQIAATIWNGGHFDSPATAAHYINCAIREIERLRNERDEARRECCTWQGLESGKRKQDVAVARGWDYLRWPDPGALDRLAKLDEELGF
jgi:hypothetical protein